MSQGCVPEPGEPLEIRGQQVEMGGERRNVSSRVDQAVHVVLEQGAGGVGHERHRPVRLRLIGNEGAALLERGEYQHVAVPQQCLRVVAETHQGHPRCGERLTEHLAIGGLDVTRHEQPTGGARRGALPGGERGVQSLARFPPTQEHRRERSVGPNGGRGRPNVAAEAVLVAQDPFGRESPFQEAASHRLGRREDRGRRGPLPLLDRQAVRVEGVGSAPGRREAEQPGLGRCHLVGVRRMRVRRLTHPGRPHPPCRRECALGGEWPRVHHVETTTTTHETGGSTIVQSERRHPADQAVRYSNPAELEGGEGLDSLWQGTVDTRRDHGHTVAVRDQLHNLVPCRPADAGAPDGMGKAVQHGQAVGSFGGDQGGISRSSRRAGQRMGGASARPRWQQCTTGRKWPSKSGLAQNAPHC